MFSFLICFSFFFFFFSSVAGIHSSIHSCNTFIKWLCVRCSHDGCQPWVHIGGTWGASSTPNAGLSAADDSAVTGPEYNLDIRTFRSFLGDSSEVRLREHGSPG